MMSQDIPDARTHGVWVGVLDISGAPSVSGLVVAVEVEFA